jgi:hypothetical protein
LRLAQTVFDGTNRQRRGVLDPVEPFLAHIGNDLPVNHHRGRTVMANVNAQDLHI